MSKPTSFRLTNEATQALRRIADRHGLSQTAVLEILIRQADRDDVVLEFRGPPYDSRTAESGGRGPDKR